MDNVLLDIHLTYLENAFSVKMFLVSNNLMKVNFSVKKSVATAIIWGLTSAMMETLLLEMDATLNVKSRLIMTAKEEMKSNQTFALIRKVLSAKYQI